MTAWLPQEWCLSFVLALGHFLWQGTSIAIGLAIVLRFKQSVGTRYWLSLAALLLMAACPLVTLGWLLRPVASTSNVTLLRTAHYGPAVNPPRIADPAVDNTVAQRQVTNLPGMLPDGRPSAPRNVSGTEVAPLLTSAIDQSWWQRFAPQLTTAYLCGVALMLLRLFAGLWGGRRLQRRVRLIDDPALLSAMRRQAELLGLKLLPVLAFCEQVAVPTVIGVLKPMILLPITLACGLSFEQIESVVAHELAHLRRCDHLVNLLQRVIESLLFFHPAIWWVSQRVREEREHCCDDLVVACGAIPLNYAESLLVVAELGRASSQLRAIAAVSLLATGNRPSSLRQRIARLLGESAAPSLRLSPRVLATSVTVLLAGLAMLIQLGVSNDQSPSVNAIDPPSRRYSATLPNGDTVELVHLTRDSFSVPARHKRVWWKADGTLDTEANAHENVPEFIDRASHNARLVVVRAKTAASEPSLCLRTQPATETRHQVYLDNKDQHGNPIRTLSAAIGPVGGERSVSLRVGVALDPWGDWQQVSPQGELLNKLDLSRPYWSIYQQIKVLSGGQTVDSAVVLEWPRKYDELIAFEFRAVCTGGRTHAGINAAYSENGETCTATFRLNGEVFRDRLARLEYRLRPYQHWVTFENVALQPGQPTDVAVNIEGADPLATENVAATKPAPFGAAPQRFSEAIELVLSINSLKYMLDLDAGLTMDPPQTIRAEQKKMDVFPFDTRPNEVPAGLQGLSLRGVRTKPEGWFASVAELQKQLAGEHVGALKKLPYDNDEKATYFFRTADGTEGVLQLLAQTDNPKGMRLRYKTITAAKPDANPQAEIKAEMTFDELTSLKGGGIQRERGEEEEKPAEISRQILFFPSPVVGDFSKVDDPDVLLEQLAKSQLPSLMPQTGGGFYHHPESVPQAMFVNIWETQYVGNDKLDPRIRRLIELGGRTVPRVHQRLNGLTASDILATHLAIVLRSTGTTESVPVLIKLLKTSPSTLRNGTRSIADEIKSMNASVTQIAVTSALWKLTGRKHLFTTDQWEKWWQSVKPDFVVLRERRRQEFVLGVTPDRVESLVNEMATNEVPARERLISLGPAVLPHLLKYLSVAESLREADSRRLAWVIDELGATDKLPAKLRRDYFEQRFSDTGTFAGMYPIDEDALCRALSHCSFADYASIYLEADGQLNVASHMRHIKWPLEISAAYCRRFSKLSPSNLGDWTNNPRWSKVVPAEDPAEEIANTVPILVAALKDERAKRRDSASKLAAAIGFCSTAKPETLIVALRDAWLAEADEKVRPEVAFAMCRFQTPFVVKEICNGLLSDRFEIVGDCAGLVDWIPIQHNDETRFAFDRLVELTHHENDRVRLSSTRSLAGKAPQLLGPEFERLCTDKVKDIREACTLALRSNPDPKHADILFKLANDAEQAIRESAFWSIGNLRHPESMARLIPHLRDPKVHGFAVSALASMGGKGALPLLMKELDQGNDVDGMIYQHLVRLTGETLEHKPEPWLAWWKQQKPAP